MSQPLGIIAGDGPLPLLIARTAREAGRGVLIVAMEGLTEAGASDFPHFWTRPFDIKASIEALTEGLEGARCRDIVLAGGVYLPDASDAAFLERVPEDLLKRFFENPPEDFSDDSLISILLGYLEEARGFRVLAVEDVCPSLRTKAGDLTALAPSKESAGDMDYALKVARQMGSLNVGQAVVIRAGSVVAVEAMEGTDAMLRRAAALLNHEAGEARRGVLAKFPRPHQDMRVDLPMVGPDTIRRASEAGLAGVALREGGALLFKREEIAAIANDAQMFVTALPSAAFS